MIKISEIETHFDVIDSLVIFEDGKKLSDNFKLLKDGRYILSAILVRNKRSKDQNNAMWGIPYMYFKKALINTGDFKNPSINNIHQYCMHHCLPEDYKERIKKQYDEIEPMVDINTGELFKEAFRLTTTKMTTKDAMNYYENMQYFYAENLSSGKENDFIPDPYPAKKKKI